MAVDPQQLAAMAAQGGDPGQLPPAPGGQDKPPPTLVPRHLQEQLAAALNDRKLNMAREVAYAYGKPDNTVELDDLEVLKLWRYRNPDVDLDALRAQGVPEEKLVDQVYPLRRGLVSSLFTWSEKVEFARKMRVLDETTERAHLGPIDNKDERPDKPPPRADR